MNNRINLLQNNDFVVVPEMEICVVCNVITPEPKNKHIDYRSNYIEGAGQLCEKCFNEKVL